MNTTTNTFLSPVLYYYETLSRFALSISLAASGICAAASYILFGDISVSSLVLPFVATMFVYNLDRVAEPSEADLISNPERTHFVAKYRMYYVVIIITAFIVMVAWSLAEGWLVFLTAIAFPLSSVLYVVPFLPFRKIKRIKEIPGLKSIYVSSCWSILVLLAVAIQNEPVEVLPVVLLMVFMFIRSVVGGLLGDMRDMEGDEAANVRSLPAIMGEKKCLMLIEILHVCSVIVAVLLIQLCHLPVWVYGIVASSLIGYFFHTKIKQQRYAPGVYFDLFDLEYHSYVPFMLLVRLIVDAQ